MELLMSTDTERGGEMTNNLRALYSFALREFLSIGRSRDVAQLDRVSNVLGNPREAFSTIATEPVPARSPAA
jgi:flagellin-specific chaperone FliS